MIIAYGIVIISFVLGWKQIPIFKPQGINTNLSISIIVALRNEEKNIKSLVDGLVNQKFLGSYEIILINDHSTDNTLSIAKSLLKNNIKLLSLPSEKTGKKSAITAGIEIANGDLIVTTDADCTIKNTWLQTIAEYYMLHKPALIIGPVTINKEKTFFEKFQVLDFISLVASGAGASGINKPIFCNGANLVYEKKIVKTFQDPLNSTIASGDDVFLLHKMKSNKNKIVFLKSTEAMVETLPAKNINEYINQRMRWSSKSTQYKDRDTLIVAWTIFLICFLQFILLPISLFSLKYAVVFSVFFLIKSIIDYYFFYSVIAFYNKNNLLKFVIPFEFIYFTYVVLIAIFGALVPYTWKKRKTN